MIHDFRNKNLFHRTVTSENYQYLRDLPHFKNKNKNKKSVFVFSYHTSFNKHQWPPVLKLIPAWKSNHVPSKMRDEIT